MNASEILRDIKRGGGGGGGGDKTQLLCASVSTRSTLHCEREFVKMFNYCDVCTKYSFAQKGSPSALPVDVNVDAAHDQSSPTSCRML